MSGKFPMRNLVLYGGLALTLAAVVWVQGQDESAQETDLVDLVAKPARSVSTKAESFPTADLHIALADPLKPEVAEPKVDLFTSHAWYVPPPPKPVVAEVPPPPVPTAPPVPFAYMGKMENAPEGTIVFLVANNKVYSVTKGEVIDRVWRLEGEDANTVRLTYLPLNSLQTLMKKARPPAATSNGAVETENQGIPG